MKKGKSKHGCGVSCSPTKGTGRLLKLGYGKKIKGYKDGDKIEPTKKEERYYNRASKSMGNKIDKNAKRILKGKSPKTLVIKKSGRSVLKKK